MSGTSNVVLEILVCSNIAASKTSFWVRPLKIDYRKLNACDVCSLECMHQESHAFSKEKYEGLIQSKIYLRV